MEKFLVYDHTEVYVSTIPGAGILVIRERNTDQALLSLTLSAAEDISDGLEIQASHERERIKESS